MSAKKATQRSANSTTATTKKSTGLSAQERAAMKERLQELKAEARKANGEKALLAKIAEMKGSDRAMAKRIHAIVTASAPTLSPKTWYGMPAYANRMARSFASFKVRRSSKRGTRPLASPTPPTSTRARCGRPRSR
jgi:uncharacterized protein YdhG (YjbR/CyaY superfamily)